MKKRIPIICLLLTLVTVTLGTFNPVHTVEAQESTLTLSFEELGIGDLRLQSLFGSASAWIPIRSDWAIQETQVNVQLNYIASPLLIPENSTMTVSAAGTPITSWRPITDGQLHSVEFAVPTSGIDGSYNGFLLQIQGQLVIDDGDCWTTNDPGQWVMIVNDSSISFNASLDTSSPQLEKLSDEIVVKNSMGTDPPPVLFVLPENPDLVDLTTAGEIAARLSREGAKTGNPLVEYKVMTVDSLQSESLNGANLVIVGEPTRNTLIQNLSSSLVTPLDGNVFTTIDNYDAPLEDGVVQVISLPWAPERRALIVSGGSPEGVAIAGEAFADSPTYHSLDREIKFVHAMEPVKESDTNPAWQGDETTFGQLQFGARTITGIGTFDEQYFLEFPPGWILLPGSQLVLDVASSPAMTSELSHVAVFLNEVPIGTITTGGDTQNVRAVFYLPIEQINVDPLGERPHKMTLRLSVSNYLSQNRCESIFAASAWTQISDSSSFITVHDYMTTPDLQAFPYPFVNDGAVSTAIIIPENPTDDEIEAGINLASTLGRYTPSDFTLEVITADKATKDSLSDSNVVMIGTFERNPLIDEFNNNMGELSNPGVYEELKDTSNGLIREGQSLWNDNRTALLIFAQTQEGVDNAALGLFDSAPPILQSGTLAVVDANQNMRILEAFEQPQLEFEGADSSEPTVMSSVGENGGNDMPSSTPGNETQVSESIVGQPSVDEEVQGKPVLGQSLPILLLILGLAVLAIPVVIWLSRNQNRS